MKYLNFRDQVETGEEKHLVRTYILPYSSFIEALQKSCKVGFNVPILQIRKLSFKILSFISMSQ